MSILVQFPTLGRPRQFIEALRLYVSKMSCLHNVHFNINCDKDDLSMNNNKVLADIRNTTHHLLNKGCLSWDIHFDLNTTKIGSINAHIRDPDLYDIIICASDDMIPYEDNWDDIIFQAMEKHFPNMDGCVSFSDGQGKDELITFSILGRELYKEFGYIYHPDYVGLYCDNEFTEEVNRMGKVVYIDKVIVGHEHYGEAGNRNSGKQDFAARKTLQFSGRDGKVYEERKRLGFPKERITNDI